MKGPPIGPGGEDITSPDQVAPRGRRAPSTRMIKPQTSNLKLFNAPYACTGSSTWCTAVHFSIFIRGLCMYGGEDRSPVH